MDFDPLILSNHFCTYFINFPPLFHIFLHFFYINTFNCVLHKDGGGDTSSDEVVVEVVLVMVVMVVFVVLVVWW